MKKIDMSIEIVSSNINELNSMNSASQNSILEVLSKYYTNVKITLIDTTTDLDLLAQRKPDLVFLGMKFLPNNSTSVSRDDGKIWISEYLDRKNITYTGSNQSAQNLEFNKEKAKDFVQKAGLKTAKFTVIEAGRPNDGHNLPSFPLFVKPTDQGGGNGIDTNSLVHSVQELNTKTASIFAELGSDSLVEEYLAGREFSIAILKSEESLDYSLMPIELIAPLNPSGARFLSASIKKADTEQYKKIKDQDIINDITVLAMDVFITLGARDYGRIDVRLDSNGVPHFLEANLIPSLLKDYGNFPKACLVNTELDYEHMILQITNLAFARSLKTVYKDLDSITPVIATVPIAI